MPRIDFTEIPDHGRLWIFPVNRALDEAEQRACLEVVDGFLDQWAAHGQPLRSGRELREGRFLLVGVDEDAEAPSGCSIDALMGSLRTLGADMGATFIDHAPVWFRHDGEIRTVSRADFRALASAGEVTRDTPVFDSSLTRIAQARAGELEKAAGDSWHGRAFFNQSARV